MDVTFPAVRSLFDGELAERASRIGISSFMPALGRAIEWEVFTGVLQVVNDGDSRLARRLDEVPPITLVLDAITGYLAEPRLHWCKLYGANMAKSGLVFGCSIDGGKSFEGEMEMRQKFTEAGPLDGGWEFRQFFTMRPAGEAAADIEAELRSKAQEAFPRRRGWLSWLTGR